MPRLRGVATLRRRAIPGDAANRSRRLRAAGREKAKVEEEQRRREAELRFLMVKFYKVLLQMILSMYTPGSSNIAGWKMGAPE